MTLWQRITRAIKGSSGNSRALIPRSVLFGSIHRSSPQISPDGTKMAFLAPLHGVLNLWVVDADGSNERAITEDKHRGIRPFFWGQDSRRLFYTGDSDGREDWRLYAVDVETKAVTLVGVESDEVNEMSARRDVQVVVAGQSRHYPSQLLLAINKVNPQFFDIYHLDLETGRLRVEARNPGTVGSWLTDSQLRVRAGMASNDDGSIDLMLRSSDGPVEWRTLLTFGPEDAMTSGPVGFSNDDKTLLMLDSRDWNSTRLVALNVETNTLDVVASDEQWDVCKFRIEPNKKIVEAVAFLKERVEWTVLEPGIQADMDAITALDHGDFSIQSQDHADENWVIAFDKDTGPVTYYIYDRKTKTGRRIFEERPALSQYRLAPMEPFSFVARDGLTIHGYLTFPLDSARRALPTVLNVHGGPWSRHIWGFSAPAQWLANRGYISLDVNFRGSAGLGKQLLNAGDREWGGKIQHDLEDAVQWAIEQGYSDPNRVGILGASFGGYAALVGASSTPELFRCAVDAFGPSNLVTFLTNVPPYWKAAKATFDRRIGDAERDREFLESRSPIFKVDQIRIPMLIAQGGNDVRVLKEESERVVAALKRNGVPHEYLYFPDEGHGFVKPKNRAKFYQRAERFLAKHLGGAYER